MDKENVLNEYVTSYKKDLIIFCSLTIFCAATKKYGETLPFVPSPSETHNTIPSFENL